MNKINKSLETFFSEIREKIKKKKIAKVKLQSMQENAINIWKNILSNQNIEKELTYDGEKRQIFAYLSKDRNENNVVTLMLHIDVNDAHLKMFYNNDMNHGKSDMIIPDIYAEVLITLFDSHLANKLATQELNDDNIINKDLSKILDKINNQ